MKLNNEKTYVIKIDEVYLKTIISSLSCFIKHDDDESINTTDVIDLIDMLSNDVTETTTETIINDFTM
jgi:hypothetical protein